MTCSKGSQAGIVPMAAAERTVPSKMGHLLYRLSHRVTQPRGALMVIMHQQANFGCIKTGETVSLFIRYKWHIKFNVLTSLQY